MTAQEVTDFSVHAIKEKEKKELEELRRKPIEELTDEEIGRFRRLLFRKNEIFSCGRDVVGDIFSTLNFPMPRSKYQDDFEYSSEKKHCTLNPDDERHKKKNFLKTFEEEKYKNRIIFRK